MVRVVELRAVLTVLTLALAALHHHQQLLLGALRRRLRRAEDEEEEDEPPPKRRRQVVPRADYRSLPWAKMLEKTDLLMDPTTREAKQFRRRFRVPYPFFVSLVDEVKAGNWRGFTTDEFELGGRGSRRCIPVEIKVCHDYAQVLRSVIYLVNCVRVKMSRNVAFRVSVQSEALGKVCTKTTSAASEPFRLRVCTTLLIAAEAECASCS